MINKSCLTLMRVKGTGVWAKKSQSWSLNSKFKIKVLKLKFEIKI